jgi:DNA helicase HerA-like ATPase
MIVRVAAEGRKYGLFLIVATQRPRKIDSNVLSECENLILMKMKNESDLSYASDILGYLEPDIATRARGLRKGDALLRGNINVTNDVLHCAPRRTAQGGKGLPDKYWTVP